MNPTDIALAIAAILVPVLKAILNGLGVGDPRKLWVEFAAAAVLAYLALVTTGVIPAVPPLAFKDPVTFFRGFVEYVTVVWAVGALVYQFLRKELEGLQAKVAAKFE